MKVLLTVRIKGGAPFECVVDVPDDVYEHTQDLEEWLSDYIAERIVSWDYTGYTGK